MVVDGHLVNSVREVLSEALFGSNYSAVVNSDDIYLINFIAAVCLIFTFVFLFKVLFWIFSLFGG